MADAGRARHLGHRAVTGFFAAFIPPLLRPQSLAASQLPLIVGRVRLIGIRRPVGFRLCLSGHIAAAPGPL